jgi:hypothetical protein
MKKVILPVSFFGLISVLLSVQSNFSKTIESYHTRPNNSGGAAAGKTGAPGEQNCTACHAGTAQNGASENTLTFLSGTNPITQYVPGQQYTVTLAMSSNPTKKGFQATALTSANAMAGTFTGQAGNTSINGTTKKYANHTSTSNTSTTAPVWTWTWTAPAAGSGNVTFYVASNKANNNNNDNGDVIYLSQHVISEASSAGINEFESETFQVSYDSDANRLTTTFNFYSQSQTSLRLVDLSGKEVLKSSLGLSEIGKNNMTIDLNKTLNKGIYLVTLQIGNKVYSKKIMV